MNARNPALLGMLAGALIIAVLALGVFAGITLMRPAAAQAQAGVAGMRQITVIGSGEARTAPDMASVQIGVETTAPTTEEALAQNNSQAQTIIDQIKQLGVDEKDIQTSGFNIYATYGNDGREVTGYTVSNTVNVTIRDLQQAGALLDAVVQAGANRIYGISFGVSDQAAVMAAARDAAVADARVRAEQLAGAGGATVGQILVITESIGAAPPMPMMMDSRAEAAGGAVPVQAGEQTFTVQVQVTYELR